MGSPSMLPHRKSGFWDRLGPAPPPPNPYRHQTELRPLWHHLSTPLPASPKWGPHLSLCTFPVAVFWNIDKLLVIIQDIFFMMLSCPRSPPFLWAFLVLCIHLCSLILHSPATASLTHSLRSCYINEWICAGLSAHLFLVSYAGI